MPAVEQDLAWRTVEVHGGGAERGRERCGRPRDGPSRRARRRDPARGRGGAWRGRGGVGGASGAGLSGNTGVGRRG